jgi:hypothetical protein
MSEEAVVVPPPRSRPAVAEEATGEALGGMPEESAEAFLAGRSPNSS